VISAVTAHNFKGATFQAPLGGMTLVVGPNGAGKSSRSQALQLAVLGYVPGAGKRNGDIMGAFQASEGKDLRAGIVLESGKKLERRFTRSRTGAVSMEMYAGGIKCSAPEFARALADVAVVDLSVFLGLSDAKKIDELFRLFPPEGNVRDIAAKIEAQAKQVAALERQEREASSMVSNLMSRRSKINLPAGSMADKQNEIDRAEADLRQARADLEAERIAAARAEEKAKAQEEALLAQGRAALGEGQNFTPFKPGVDAAPMPASPAPIQTMRPIVPSTTAPAGQDIQAILQHILSTMDRAGCDVCAARMVIKCELTKARRGLPLEAVA